MPEARDRRTSINSGRSLDLTPFRWGTTPLTGGQRPVVTRPTRGGGDSNSGRALFQTPMPATYRRGGRNQNQPPSTTNTFRRGRGGRAGARSGVLPSWYPRTPLGDVTHVVRAMERRRGGLGEGAGHILGSPTPIRMSWMNRQPADQDEYELSFVTPKAKLGAKTLNQSGLGRIPLILTAIANQCEGESESKTPQKRLLDSIEIVEKVVMEELQRLKRTPSAKKAEREKKVRILMSMR
ncbi:protein POLYCHOME-like [Bidens hawaiensis]|uniref:protein POLYCHOME-like n=1 Tax=Bidens hawaiensis TaxID=980011 RepID=UPI00404B0AB2